ncbi:MAG: anhydro-N-acetylmuramic acid kinase, partial [Bacteroidota bacterium]
RSLGAPVTEARVVGCPKRVRRPKKEKLAPLGISIVDDFPESWIDYKEAIIFAFLGLRTLLGHPTTLASVTGAPNDLVTGAIHIPPSGGMNFLD